MDSDKDVLQLNLLRLRANTSHPTYKKLERLIELLEELNLCIELQDGVLRIRDHEFAVSFDMLDVSDNTPIYDLPPIFAYKLIRDKFPNKLCKCNYCKPKTKE